MRTKLTIDLQHFYRHLRSQKINYEVLKVLVTQEYTYNQMAETLNREGFVTSQGFQFTPSTVYKLIKRYNLR